MERFDIEKAVTDEVNNWYDYERDTMESALELGSGVTASITKEQGDNVECEFFDADGEEIQLPCTREFIERVAMEAISDIREQQRNSPDYDREMFEEWARGGWR